MKLREIKDKQKLFIQTFEQLQVLAKELDGVDALYSFDAKPFLEDTKRLFISNSYAISKNNASLDYFVVELEEEPKANSPKLTKLHELMASEGKDYVIHSHIVDWMVAEVVIAINKGEVSPDRIKEHVKASFDEPVTHYQR